MSAVGSFAGTELALRAMAVTACLAVAAAGPALAGPTTVLIAGDIAHDSPSSQAMATADLVANRRGLVMTAGDNAYPDGSYAAFLTPIDGTYVTHVSLEDLSSSPLLYDRGEIDDGKLGRHHPHVRLGHLL